MDGIILVVQASWTPRDQVARAAEKLRVVKARVLGALLNKVDVATNASYYRSYYAYYGQDDSAEKVDAASEVAAADEPQSKRRARRFRGSS